MKGVPKADRDKATFMIAANGYCTWSGTVTSPGGRPVGQIAERIPEIAALSSPQINLGGFQSARDRQAENAVDGVRWSVNARANFVTRRVACGLTPYSLN
jgi:hypothetical protein